MEAKGIDMRSWLIVILMLAWLNSCTTGSTYYSGTTSNVNFGKYNTYKWLPKDSSTITNVLYDNTFLSNAIEYNANKILGEKGYKLSASDSAELLIQYTFIVENKSDIITSKSITTIPESGPRNFFQPFNPYSPTSAYNGIGPYPGIYEPYDSPQYIYYYNSPGNMYTPGYYSNNYPYYSPYGFPYNGNNVVMNDVQSVSYKEGTLIIDIMDAKTKEIIWRSWNVDGLSDPNTYKNKIPLVIKDIFGEIPEK